MHERMEFPWKVKEAEALQTIGKAFTVIVGGVEEMKPDFEGFAKEVVAALVDLVQTADMYWTPDKSTQWPALDAARDVLRKIGIEVEKC